MRKKDKKRLEYYDFCCYDLVVYYEEKCMCFCVVNEWNIILMMRETYICMFAYDMRKSM